jgi:predicted aspartyl protease
MSTIAYSRDYWPPAPVLPVALAPPDEAPRFGAIPALIDTGADGTFVPTQLIERLGIMAKHITNVRAHMGGTSYRAAVYSVDLLIADTLRFPAMDVVGDDWGDQIILGRNVLNRLQLYLDGPGAFTQLGR